MSKSRILVVDDNKNIAKTMSTILRVSGYEAEFVFSGEEALRLVSKRFGTPRQIDLVLTDYQMPGMSGAQLQQKLSDRYPTLPVVMVTGQAIKDIRDVDPSLLLEKGEDNLVRRLVMTVENTLTKARAA